MLFSKPKDLRTEQKQNHQHLEHSPTYEDKNEKKTGNIYWQILLIPLLPIFLLFKLIEYIHLLTIIIFGGLFLYFGVTKLYTNSWAETALLMSIGLVLVIAPIFYALDKDK